MSVANLKPNTEHNAANDEDARPSAEELTQLAARADRVTFTPDATTPLFNIEDFRASRFLRTSPPPRRWLMKGIIPAGIVCQLVAPGGTGKTMIAMQLGVSCATGLPFAGAWEPVETGSVLMLLGEDDDSELHRRVYNIANQIAVTSTTAATQLGERLFIKSVIGEDNLLTSTEADTREVRHTPLVDRLIVTAKQIPDLKLIVIDPASRFRGGDENAAGDTTRFVQALERIAQATGATVLVIHHANKASMTASSGSQSAARGSSALTDGVRLQINLATLNKDTGKRYGLTEDDCKGYLTLSIAKTNYSAPQNDILLKRGEGGYLSLANDVPIPRAQAGLPAAIAKLIRSEAAAGNRHSKSGFAKLFGGADKQFKLSHNELRAQLDDMIAAKTITTDHGKMQIA